MAHPTTAQMKRVAGELTHARRLLCAGHLDEGLDCAGRWCGWMQAHQQVLLWPPDGVRGPLVWFGARLAVRRALGELLGVAGMLLLADQRDDEAAEAMRWADVLLCDDCPVGASYERMMHDLGGW
jgi:hypothetical protein